MTPDDFRAVMTAFADLVKFPDAQVAFWLASAEAQVPEKRWGAWRDMGVMFLAAHRLTLAAAAAKATDGTGGMDAAGGGIISESKTVGGISKSISRAGAAATADANAGQYNDTSYGKQYWSLAMSVGAGGLVV